MSPLLSRTGYIGLPTLWTAFLKISSLVGRIQHFILPRKFTGELCERCSSRIKFSSCCNKRLLLGDFISNLHVGRCLCSKLLLVECGLWGRHVCCFEPMVLKAWHKDNVIRRGVKGMTISCLGEDSHDNRLYDKSNRGYFCPPKCDRKKMTLLNVYPNPQPLTNLQLKLFLVISPDVFVWKLINWAEAFSLHFSTKEICKRTQTTLSTAKAME